MHSKSYQQKVGYWFFTELLAAAARATRVSCVWSWLRRNKGAPNKTHLPGETEPADNEVTRRSLCSITATQLHTSDTSGAAAAANSIRLRPLCHTIIKERTFFLQSSVGTDLTKTFGRVVCLQEQQLFSCDFSCETVRCRA
jgi:hypothetical protein